MKKLTSALLAYCMLSSGCALHKAESGSFDALSNDYAIDAQSLAQQTAEELSLRHAPAHTPLALAKVPGSFGDMLESDLRSKGFALVPAHSTSSVGVVYKLDKIQQDDFTLGYVQVSSTDGQIFSFTRALNNPGQTLPVSPVMYTEPPLSTPLPDEHPIKSHPLPEGSSSPAPSIVGTLPSDPPARTYPVRRQATASVIAKRNKVGVESFCRWNDVPYDQVLPVGYPVFLSEPPAKTIAAAAHPNPVTPSVTPEEEIPVSTPAAAAQNDATPTPISTPTPIPAVATVKPLPRQTSPAPYVPDQQKPIEPTPQVHTLENSSPTQPEILPEPEPIPTPLPQWEISKGEMLQSQMEGWAAVAGYTLIWNAHNDYEMRSSATFTGEFIDAVRSFFAALQANGIALRVTIYQGNRVMEVSAH